MTKYSIVIPFFNEEKNIYFVIKSLNKILKKIKYIEFILVNNGSTDNSKKVFNLNLKNENKKIFKYYEVKKNIGYGHGIKYGLSKAKGNFLGWTHADMQTNPTDVIKAIMIINKTRELNLFIKGKRKNRNKKEIIQTKAMEYISSILLNVKIKDINAQPKIITKTFYKNYIKNFAPDDLSLDLFAYYLALKKKYKIYEVDVLFKKRKYGETKGGGEGGSILTKLRLIFVTLRCLFKIKFIKI